MTNINKIARTIAGYSLIGFPAIILFIILAIEQGLFRTSIAFAIMATLIAIFLFFINLGFKILDSRNK